jgi:hypothetical protein
MTYSLAAMSNLDANLNVAALNTNKAAPQFTINQHVTDAFNRNTQAGSLYLTTVMGSALNSSTQKATFSIYIRDPECDPTSYWTSGKITAPTETTKSAYVLIAASSSWTYTIPAKFTDSTSNPGPCPTVYALDSASISNAQIRAMVSFNAATDVITITTGTDDSLHKAAMGTHTITFLVQTQAGNTISGSTYVLTLTLDHADCPAFRWNFQSSTATTFTDTTPLVVTTDGTFPVAMTLPTIVTPTGAATHCLYKWDSTFTVANTAFVATEFTYSTTSANQISFTGIGTFTTNPWARHTVTQLAKNLAGTTILTWTKTLHITKSACETTTNYSRTDESVLYYITDMVAPSSTSPTTLTHTTNCAVYMKTPTIPTSLSAFAAWDATNNRINYTKMVTDVLNSKYGEYDVTLTWQSVNGVDLSSKVKKLVISQPACEPSTVTISTGVTGSLTVAKTTG